MYHRLLLVGFGLLIIISCTKNTVKEDDTPMSNNKTATAVDNTNPPWIRSLINELSAEPTVERPAQIVQYSYRDVIVYYVPTTTVFRQSVLYGDSGNVICYPDGGVTGSGDGKCTDFHRVKTNEKLIWRNEE